MQSSMLDGIIDSWAVDILYCIYRGIAIDEFLLLGVVLNYSYDKT